MRSKSRTHLRYHLEHPKEFEHSALRAFERYALVLTPEAFDFLCLRCALRKDVKIAWEEPENAQVVFSTLLYGTKIFLVWALKRECITTILRPQVCQTEPMPTPQNDIVSPVWLRDVSTLPARARVDPQEPECCDGFYTEKRTLCERCWPEGLPKGVELLDRKFEV